MMDKDKDNGDLMEKMKEKLSGKTKIILILGLIGIGLIFISNFLQPGITRLYRLIPPNSHWKSILQTPSSGSLRSFHP